MFSEFSDFVLGQLANLGFSGVVIGFLGACIIALWRKLSAATERNDYLVDKMIMISSETSVMLERITGR